MRKTHFHVFLFIHSLMAPLRRSLFVCLLACLLARLDTTYIQKYVFDLMNLKTICATFVA